MALGWRPRPIGANSRRERGGSEGETSEAFGGSRHRGSTRCGLRGGEHAVTEHVITGSVVWRGGVRRRSV